MTETMIGEGISPVDDSGHTAEVIAFPSTADAAAGPSRALPESLGSLDEEQKSALRNFLHDELGHMLEDISFRIGQAYDVERRSQAGHEGLVYTEDLNLLVHLPTGYTMTANSPAAGSIAWTDVHIVFNGVDYTCANGNTANKYVWFVKPASGTTATLQTGNTKPVLGPNDCLVFFNNAGTPVNALTSSIPVAVVDGAIDNAALANGAVTAAKTDFYSTLSTAITNAQEAADLAQATADGSITTHMQGTAPWPNGSTQSAGKVGDLWLDDDGQAYRWTGASGTPVNTWKLITDNGVAKAISDAAAAAGLAGTKITTFYSSDAAVPTALAVGDLWVVTNKGNLLRRATAVGTANWVSVQISGEAIANGGVGNTQLGSGIDGAKLSSGTVGSTQLGNGAVQPSKLNILQHIMF